LLDHDEVLLDGGMLDFEQERLPIGDLEGTGTTTWRSTPRVRIGPRQ
jgi:hypothetical protein